MVNDEVVAKLVGMGFTSTQIREAGVALPGASQSQIVDYLLGIGSGAAVQRLNEVRLRDMGFTTAQIRLAHEAVGSLSNVAALTEWLLRSGQEPLGQELVAAGGVRDLRAELVRKLKHHSLSEVQVDNALDAVGGVADSSEASIEKLRKWIFENMELSNRPSTRLIRSKLLDLGLSAEEATRKAEAAWRVTSSLQSAINFAMFGSVEEGGSRSVVKEDLITGERLAVRDMFICECNCQHMLGYQSFFEKIMSDVRERRVPACPLNNIPGGCNYVLTQKETEDVIAAVMRSDELRAQCVTDDTFKVLELEDAQMLVNGQRGWKSQLVSRLYMHKAKVDGGFTECPEQGCGWFVEAMDTRLIVCNKCNFRFCAACKRQFHYSGACDEIVSFARNWTLWLEEGRPQVLTHMAASNVKFQAALQAFKQQKVQHTADMQNRKQQYAQMMADEQWKEANCRRCPHGGCGFVIQKLDGCDAMVCGRDYHGNIMQGGCGKNFNWTAAAPYKADTGHHPKVEAFVGHPPAQQMQMLYFEDDGVTPTLCACCAEQVHDAQIARALEEQEAQDARLARALQEASGLLFEEDDDEDEDKHDLLELLAQVMQDQDQDEDEDEDEDE